MGRQIAHIISFESIGKGRVAVSEMLMRGQKVVCRDGALDDAAFLGLRYGEMYEVSESARAVVGGRFVYVRDRFGREVRVSARRFRSLRGRWEWDEDGTPVCVSEKFREQFAEFMRAKTTAKDLLLGGMVRRRCLHLEMYHAFADLPQKMTAIFMCGADTNLTFISPCKAGMTPAEKKTACELLVAYLQVLSFGFIRLEGHWGSPAPEEGEVDADYPYAIMNVGLGTQVFTEIAMALAVKYEQDTVYVWSPETRRAYTFKVGLCTGRVEDEEHRADFTFSTGKVLKEERQLLEKSIARAVGNMGGRPENHVFEFSKDIKHEADCSDFKLHMECMEFEGTKERCLLHAKRTDFVKAVQSAVGLQG